MLTERLISQLQTGWLPQFLHDVTVIEGDARQALPAPAASGVLWQAQPGHFLLHVPEVADYDVREGVQIIFRRASSATDERIARFLRAAPLAALLFQRRVLAFHAAAVATPGGALMIAGLSASGKSTLAAALAGRDCPLLADDLTAVDFTGEMPMVCPFAPELILWPDAVRELGLDAQSLTPIETGAFSYRAPRQLTGEQLPLRALIVLETHPGSTVQRQTISGTRRFELIGQFIYNSAIAHILLDSAWLFSASTMLARHATLDVLQRPRDRWTLEALITEIEGLLL